MIDVEGRRYRFAAHPSAPRMVYALEASRATVYQVIAPDGTPQALKVFKARFRKPALVEGTRTLAPLCSLPGLRAAERSIVTAPPADLPDLQYAVFIPWIRGSTWADLLMKARRGETLGLDSAVRLCDRFLTVIETLQSRGIAHTDLSPANVVFDVAALDVQLVDLEDMYTGTGVQPVVPSRGSRGYQHPAGETCWHADGDRYAAAVLAAEILLSADAPAMQFATDEYCFGPNTGIAGQEARAEFLRARLRLIFGTFATSFERAWTSSALADCPPAAELRRAIAPLRMQLDAGIRWVPREKVPAKVAAVAPRRFVPPPEKASASPLAAGLTAVGLVVVFIILFLMMLAAM